MKNLLSKIMPVIVAGTIGLAGVAVQAEENNELLQTSETAVEIDIDDANAVNITMSGKEIKSDSDKVSISGSTITITQAGNYILSGSLENGSVIVNAGKEDKVQISLNGVSINSDTFAPIYVAQAGEVSVTLEEGTDNLLVNGGTFEQVDDNKVDAVIFSKDAIVMEGSGSLTIQSPAAHGIVVKDEMTIKSGTYEITTSDTAISAKDSITVADGTFKLTSDADGFHAENDKDDTVGNICISGGTFNINVGDDGIHANTLLEIDGGTFDITAAEGLEATYITINNGDISIVASDDGINAAQKSSKYSPTIEINDGNIKVVMGPGDTDGIDANGSIVINGGVVDVTGGSTFDYDDTGVINGGTVIVNGQQVDTLPTQRMGGHGGKRTMDGSEGKDPTDWEKKREKKNG